MYHGYKFNTCDAGLTISTWGRRNLPDGVTIHKIQQGGKRGVTAPKVQNWYPNWNDLVIESDGGAFRNTWGPQLKK